MKTKLALTFATLLAVGASASAHELDEYVQATTLSVEQDRIQAQMRLTPGHAVFPVVMASIDADKDRVFSKSEQRAYAQRTLGDMSLTVDGKRLRLRLVSWKFATMAELKEGRGDIELAFTADVPRGARRTRRLVFENHHQSRIAAYLVNCLVPREPEIRVTFQRRNYTQSRYQLDYTQAPVRSRPSSSASAGTGRRHAMGGPNDQAALPKSKSV